MNPQAGNFLKMIRHPMKFRLYLFSKLPAAFFSAVRVQYLNDNHSIVTVPYKWFSQNPFRSTYFACLAMAAEMSTGLLAMLNTYKREPVISMLVTKVEGEFIKKAVGLTTFICEEGKLISDTIENCIESNEATSLRIASTGTNGKGEIIAIFFITWSFKAKHLTPNI